MEKKEGKAEDKNFKQEEKRIMERKEEEEKENK